MDNRVNPMNPHQNLNAPRLRRVVKPIKIEADTIHDIFSVDSEGVLWRKKSMSVGRIATTSTLDHARGDVVWEVVTSKEVCKVNNVSYVLHGNHYIKSYNQVVSMITGVNPAIKTNTVNRVVRLWPSRVEDALEIDGLSMVRVKRWSDGTVVRSKIDCGRADIRLDDGVKHSYTYLQLKDHYRQLALAKPIAAPAWMA